MNKKIFKIEHFITGGEIEVEINFDHVNDFGSGPVNMETSIKMLVDFWSGNKDRLTDNGGDYTKTFLKQLCQICLKLELETGYNASGLVRLFATMEGYCRMDGSCGIKITAVSGMELDCQDDYDVKENTEELCEG